MTKTLSFCPSSYSVCLEVTCRIISFLPSGEIALSMIFRKVSFTLRGISSGQFFGNLMLQKSFFDVILIFPLLVNLAKNNRFFKKICEIEIFNFTEFYVYYVAFSRDNFSATFMLQKSYFDFSPHRQFGKK